MPLKVRVTGLVLLFLACSRGIGSKGGEYKVFVRIDTVRVGRLEKDIPVWCRVKGKGDYTVVPDVVGIVGRIVKEEGAYVRKGDTIMYVYRGPAYGDAPIVAPVPGRISLITVSEGDPVAVGTPVATVSGGGKNVVEMVVPETYVSKVKVGEPVEFEGRRGKLVMVSDVLVREVGGYPAKAEIPGLRKGSMGICRIIYEESPPLKVIPRSAFYKGKIFKVTGGRAVGVPVEVVFDDGRGHLGVEGEISRGDTVVVLGMESLKDGDRVVF